MLFCTDFYPPEEAGEQIEDYFLSGSEEETDENGNTETIHLVALSKEEEEECRSRVDMVLEKLPEIDRILEGVAEGWRLGRMGRVELTILRLACFEIRFDDSVPDKVAINEAVELAKKFGGDESPSFVNGVLAKLV
jgi:N utilization substance protein B